MSTQLTVGVIGLGKFGLKFGQTLVQLGHQVVGVDQDEEMVRRAQQILTQVFVADAMEKKALEQLGFADLSHVLISVGDSIAASSMIALYLKEIGGPSVWAKAVNTDHEKLLSKVGVDEVIIPEHMAAKQLANRIAFPGLIEKLPFDPDMALKEISVDKWAGQTLRQINPSNRFGIQIIAIKQKNSGKYHYIPKADDILEKDDVLVLIGSIDKISALSS